MWRVQEILHKTNRRIRVRREHKNAVAQKTQTSSLAQHVLSTAHKIDFQNTKIIAKSENLATRTIREAIEIEKSSNNLNKRDDAQRLPSAQRTVLSQCRLPLETD